MKIYYDCCCLTCWKTWKTDVKPTMCPHCHGLKMDIQIEKKWEV